MTGVTQLGYLGIAVRDPAGWYPFLEGAVGLSRGEAGPGGGTAYRIDDYAARLFLEAGEPDDLCCVGWEVEDAAALAKIADRLRVGGYRVSRGDEAACRRRGVAELVETVDPSGVPVELYCDPRRASAAGESDVVREGFVAGREGLGHVVLACPDLEAGGRFYLDALGLRESDQIVAALGDAQLRVLFLHANPRHHSLALVAGLPLAKRIHHFMLEMRSLEDVGRALDRCVDAGVPIARGLGMHPNDRMLSFYAVTPAGFELELGWGGLRIEDEGAWTTQTYRELSTWGHRPPAVRSLGG